MNLDRFDLNLLVAFEALMTEGQVSRLREIAPGMKLVVRRVAGVFELPVEQFLDSSHVVVYYPASGTGIVDRLLMERGERRRKIAMEVPHFTTAVFAAGRSDLIASVPSRIAGQLSAAAGVRIFKFPFPAPALSYSLNWHSRHTPDPAHAWLRQLMIGAAADRPPASRP